MEKGAFNEGLFSRQLLAIGVDSQRKLHNSKVAVVGENSFPLEIGTKLIYKIQAKFSVRILLLAGINQIFLVHPCPSSAKIDELKQLNLLASVSAHKTCTDELLCDSEVNLLINLDNLILGGYIVYLW
jgi:hypothetical protein